MGSQMPELGSKISLISKADIRYEGQLFTVDPTECTIALANVRSFGTEDRETQYPVPAQSQVYDYILFRGSDIKDIKVIPSQLPNDPAIVQAMPPNVHQAVGYQGPGFSHPVIGPPVPSVLGQYSGYSGLGGTLGGLQRAQGPLMMKPSELGVTGPPPHPDVSQPPPQLQATHVPIGPLSIEKDQDLMGAAARSTTPSLTRKSPTNDQSTQVNSSPGRDDYRKPRPIQPPHRQHQREPMSYHQSGHRNYQNDNRRDYQNQQQQQQQQQHRGYRSHDRMDRHSDRENREPRRDQNRGGNGGGGGGGGGMWVPRNNSRQRGNRQRGPAKQFIRQGPGGSGMQGNQMKKTKPKFEGDYDFDKANTEFEKLRSQFSNVKIGSADDVTDLTSATTSDTNPAKLNGELDKREGENVTNDTTTGGGIVGAGGDVDHDVSEPCYDKSKSFFDTISCEAVERSKGRSQRTDWRTERKLNSETFGVASTRRGGGYRRGGGGGYYGNKNYPRPPRGDGMGGQPRSQQQQPQQTNSNSNDNKNNVQVDKKVLSAPSTTVAAPQSSECQS